LISKSARAVATPAKSAKSIVNIATRIDLDRNFSCILENREFGAIGLSFIQARQPAARGLKSSGPFLCIHRFLVTDIA
jgi:hypothetical protein